MSATNGQMALEPEQLNPTDRAILDELHEGRASPAYIADKHGYTTGNVRNRMTNLKNHAHVKSLGSGLYELVDDPREETTDEPDLRAELQDALEARDDAQARADRLEEALEDHQARLEDCQQRLGPRDEAPPPEGVETVREAAAAIERALDQLPEDAPGRMALADAQALLEEVLGDAE